MLPFVRLVSVVCSYLLATPVRQELEVQYRKEAIDTWIHIAAGLFALVAFMGSHCRAQLANPDQVGIVPYGTYAGGTVDRVNMTNGSLTVRIPLYSLPQKGSLSYNISVTMNSSSITASKNCEIDSPASTDFVGSTYCDVQYSLSPPNTTIGTDDEMFLLAGTEANSYLYSTCQFWNGGGVSQPGGQTNLFPWGDANTGVFQTYSC